MDKVARPALPTAWAVVAAALTVAGGCGGEAAPRGQTGGSTAGQPGGDPASGGAGGNTGTDPSTSLQWQWRACGALAAAPRDVSVVMAPDGSSVAIVDETHAARIQDLADPSRRQPVGQADFLVYASDATLYLGTISDVQGVVLQPATPGPGRAFGLPSGASCGHGAAAFSIDGSLFMLDDGPRSTNGQGHTCVWNVSDGAWLGALDGGEAFRGPNVVSLGCDGGLHVSTRSPSGTVISTVALEADPTFCPVAAWISPTGDRVATINLPGLSGDEDMGAILWDADTGSPLVTVPVQQVEAAGVPDGVFAPAGDRVLLGDGVFSTKDGVRLADAGLPKGVSGALALSPDGRTGVVIRYGRSELLSLTDRGTIEWLGSLAYLPSGPQRIADLALSADGGLLAVQPFQGPAFILRVAAAFEGSVALWPMIVFLETSADIDGTGTFATAAGAGRYLYRVSDGDSIWGSSTSPTATTHHPCTAAQLRLSPTGRWAAGAGDTGTIDVFPTASDTPQRLVALPSTGCQDAAAFSPDETLMATSTPAVYLTGERPEDWQAVWSMPAATPPAAPSSRNDSQWGQDVRFSPDATTVLVSRCEDWTCDARLYAVADGAELATLPALTAPHPSFSPEGHWVVAGGTLQHLPSGTVRTLDIFRDTTVALFAPNGDIIAGSADQSLTRYCRDP